MPRMSVGPTAEQLVYNDTIRPSQARHLSKEQFHTLPVEVNMPSVDNGWLGPLGSYGQGNSGGYMGYGVNSYTGMSP